MPRRRNSSPHQNVFHHEQNCPSARPQRPFCSLFRLLRRLLLPRLPYGPPIIWIQTAPLSPYPQTKRSISSNASAPATAFTSSTSPDSKSGCKARTCGGCNQRLSCKLISLPPVYMSCSLPSSLLQKGQFKTKICSPGT